MTIGHLLERRRHFRLRFPKSERPIFDSTHGRLVVLEAAEQGLLVAATNIGHVGEPVTGLLIFQDGHRVDIQTLVFRVECSATVLNDVRGVAIADMLREQRRLMRKYPATDFLMPPRTVF